MSKNAKEDPKGKQIEIQEPSGLIHMVLEVPPNPESAASSVGAALFSEEAFVAAMSKLSVLEALIRLSTRDCKFTDFIREILLTIMRAVKCEAGSIFEVDRHNNTLFFRSCVGQSSDSLPQFVIPLGQGIVGHVAEARLPVVVNDVSENKRHLKSIQDAVAFDARNLIAVPLVIRGQTYGVLELLNRIGTDGFSTDDVELLSYLCEMASKVIETRMMISWAKQNQKKEAA